MMPVDTRRHLNVYKKLLGVKPGNKLNFERLWQKCSEKFNLKYEEQKICVVEDL